MLFRNSSKLFILSGFFVSLLHASTGTGTVDCFNQGEETHDLTQRDAQILCTGAESAAPISCFVKADESHYLGLNESRELCTGATSDAPFDCFAIAKSLPGVTYIDARSLCLGSPVAQATVNCFSTANDSFQLSKPESIQLCAGSADSGPYSCFTTAIETHHLGHNDALDMCRVRDRFRP